MLIFCYCFSSFTRFSAFSNLWNKKPMYHDSFCLLLSSFELWTFSSSVFVHFWNCNFWLWKGGVVVFVRERVIKEVVKTEQNWDKCFIIKLCKNWANTVRIVREKKYIERWELFLCFLKSRWAVFLSSFSEQFFRIFTNYEWELRYFHDRGVDRAPCWEEL